MSAPSRRNPLVLAVALANLIFGGLCLALGVYVLWAGSDAVASLMHLKREAGALSGDPQARQAVHVFTGGMSALILAAAGVLGGCSIAQGLPQVLVGVGLLLRHTWARVFGLLFAVLFGLEGVGLLLGPPSPSALVLGLVFIAYAILSFVGLLGRWTDEPGSPETSVIMPTSQTPAPAGSRVALAVLSVALVLSILATVTLALRPVSFAFVAPAGATPGPDGKIAWQVRPVQWLSASWPDTRAAYRENVARFHEAAARGQLSRVLEMFQLGASADDKDDKGQTALMHAAEKGHTSIVVLLLAAGAWVNEKDEQGQTALMRAAENGHLGIVEVLTGYAEEKNLLQSLRGQLANLRPTLRAKDGGVKVTGLDLGALTGPLVDRSRVEVNARDREGRTAFYKAARNDHLLIAAHLGGRTSADAMIADKEGTTPLHLLANMPRSIAWSNQWAKLAPEGSYTVWLGPGQITLGNVGVADGKGMEPWMIAAAAGHLNVVQKLLPTRELALPGLEKRNRDGKTGLELARQAGHKDVVAYLEGLMKAKK